MRNRLSPLLLLTLLPLLLACSDDQKPSTNAGTDTGMDAETDTGTDSGTDTGKDVTDNDVRKCQVPADCDDNNPCTTDFCSTEGVCENLPNTLPCDDGDPCTGNTVCADGVCHGTELCCTDGLDNDGDGKIDCADVDCALDPACFGKCPVVNVPAPVPLTPLSGEATPGKHESTGVNGFTDEYVYNQADAIKIGVRREWGGSVVFFGMANGSPGMNNTNTIDANDTGREVQVAFYDPDRIRQGCAHNASCRTTPTTCPTSITYLGWNPVQGGNRCNNGSGVESVDFANGVLTVTVNPLHWNPNWDRADCVSEACADPQLAWRRSEVRVVQSLRFVRHHVVELDYTIHNLGDIARAETVHELPTVYSANGNGGPDLWRLFTSDGTEVPIDVLANDSFYYRNFTSPGGWVTLQDNNLAYGVGLYYENRLTAFQGWQNRSLPFNNFRSLFSFAIPAHGTVRARSYLIIGSQNTIKSEAAFLDVSLPPFGMIDAPASDAAVSSDTLAIRGWALDNRGVVTVEAILDGGVPVALTPGQSRPDVCTVWPGYPSCPAVGYSGTIDLKPYSYCHHLLEIRATDTDGNARVIARRRFSRIP